MYIVKKLKFISILVNGLILVINLSTKIYNILITDYMVGSLVTLSSPLSIISIPMIFSILLALSSPSL